jgi:hypothetical protein
MMAEWTKRSLRMKELARMGREVPRAQLPPRNEPEIATLRAIRPYEPNKK